MPSLTYIASLSMAMLAAASPAANAQARKLIISGGAYDGGSFLPIQTTNGGSYVLAQTSKGQTPVQVSFKGSDTYKILQVDVRDPETMNKYSALVPLLALGSSGAGTESSIEVVQNSKDKSWTLNKGSVGVKLQEGDQALFLCEKTINTNINGPALLNVLSLGAYNENLTPPTNCTAVSLKAPIV